jgi:hypothetical protein
MTACYSESVWCSALILCFPSLMTGFSYHPMTQPAPPSELRQKVYANSERSGLIGPDGDPEGWKTLPIATQSGLLFGKDTVKLDIQVRFPLSFTFLLCWYADCFS